MDNYLLTIVKAYIGIMENLIEWKNANVHVLNHGLHYASCVFEGERAIEVKFLKLKNIQKDF